MLSGSQVDVFRIAHELAFGEDFTFGTNVKLTGKSGLQHKFDLVLTSRENEHNKVAVLQNLSEDLISDIMEFNAIARDCGIQMKAILVENQLNSQELKLANVCNISVVKTDNGIEESGIFGIKKLDDNVGRLVRKGNIYMISGPSGSGKTVTGAQFLIEGAKRGEKGIVILGDQSGRDFISQVETFSDGFRSYYKEGTIQVLELSNRILKMKENLSFDYNSVNSYIRTLTGQIKMLVAEYEITRLVIDPITPMIVGDNDFLAQFFKALAIPQTYTLITSRMGKSDLSVYGIEESLVSGIFKLEINESDSETRKLSIIKMSCGGYNPAPMFFKITSNGIVSYDDEEGSVTGPLFNQVVL